MAGRSACWPEEQHHPAVGRTGHTACGTKRPSHKIRLDIRGDLPRPGGPRLSCRAVIHAGCNGIWRTYRHRSSPVAVIILDKAGWHTTGTLDIPDNITLLPLPPRSPAPVENVWQYLRQNWLSNRVFDNHDQIVSLCCDAWNNLTERPSKIRSIGYRKWAHGF